MIIHSTLSVIIFCDFINLVAASYWQAGGNFVINHQAANESDIKDDTEASGDLTLNRKTQAGEWLRHAEL